MRSKGATDVRRFYTARQAREAEEELRADPEFMRSLQKRGVELRDVFKTSRPLKYLGIELGDGGRTRFPLADVARLVLHPRSKDGDTHALHRSVHRRAFARRFSDVDALLGARRLFDAARDAPVSDARAFARSRYARQVRPALERLEEQTGVPVRVARDVLKKGLAAYKRGHRPGMSGHGWARARLTSFVTRGCTHFFPDHLLAKECPARTWRMWRRMPCLCGKPAQCGQYGRRTAANAPHSPAKGRTA